MSRLRRHARRLRAHSGKGLGEREEFAYFAKITGNRTRRGLILTDLFPILELGTLGQMSFDRE